MPQQQQKQQQENKGKNMKYNKFNPLPTDENQLLADKILGSLDANWTPVMEIRSYPEGMLVIWIILRSSNSCSPDAKQDCYRP